MPELQTGIGDHARVGVASENDYNSLLLPGCKMYSFLGNDCSRVHYHCMENSMEVARS